MTTHNSLHHKKIDISHSRFTMWRAVISVAHADGYVSREEDDYIRGVLARWNLSAEQEAIIESDFKSPEDPFELLAQINEAAVRSDLLYFARLLAYKDGQLHPNEDELLKKLHLRTSRAQEMDAIRAQVRENVSSQMIAHELETDAGRPDKGLYGLIDRLLVHLGIDVMDDR